MFLFLVASCVPVKKHNAGLGTEFSIKELHTDVDFTYKKLKKLHPNLYQYISKKQLDEKFDSLKNSIAVPMHAKRFYAALTPVVSEVRQAHISNSFPDRRFTKKERKILKKLNQDFYELDVAYADNGLWVTRTGKYDSILLGSQVVALGLETVPDILKRYRKTFPNEGYNVAFQNKFISKNFVGLFRKHEGFKDSISVLFMQGDSVFPKHFKRYLRDSSEVRKPAIDSAKVAKSKKPTKEEKAAAKLKRKQRKRDHRKFGHIARGELFTRNFKFLDSSAKIGYLNIRSWSNGPYQKFYRESFAKLDSAKTENLIIDLRDNTGGRMDEVDKLYSYLTDAEYVLAKPAKVNTRLPYIKGFYGPESGVFSVLSETIVLPYFVIHNLLKSRKTDGQLYFRYGYAKKSKPNTLNFKGRVFVLINGASFSASSIFASKLHGMKRAVFIGEETGGAYNGTVAGHFKIITLPNTKLNYRIGLMQIETPHSQQPDGFGIIPDFQVIPTVKDVKENRDPELEKALKLIRNEVD